MYKVNCVHNNIKEYYINNFVMKIKDIDETFSSGAIATSMGNGNGFASGGLGTMQRKKTKKKTEDAQIGGKISNTNKRYGPAKGPKFTAGAGMKNATYPPKNS